MTNEPVTIELVSTPVGWWARIPERSRPLGPYATEAIAIQGARDSIALRASLDDAIAAL